MGQERSREVKSGLDTIKKRAQFATTGLKVRDTDTVAAKAREAIAKMYYANSELPDLRDMNPMSKEPAR